MGHWTSSAMYLADSASSQQQQLKWTLAAAVAASAAAVTTSVTLLIYVLTTRREARARRADLVRQYTNDLHESQSIASVFMDIDGARCERIGYGTQQERDLVQFLDLMNVVGYHVETGVNRLNDIMPTTVAYACFRAMRNPEVRMYLRHVEVKDSEREYPAERFGYATRLGERIELRGLS